MTEGRIGKYQIVEEIGRGAMGVVYKAVDPYIGRTVAVKTIRFDILSNPQQREEAQKRFLREAQSAGNLSHPNIVTIYDVGEDQGMAYIAMEFVEGQSLEQILAAQRPWDPPAAVSLMIQIAEGLDSAHRKGIVHRDIKPANILIDREGRPKIVDFGIARISSSSLTQTSMVMGTPFYMSPEQVAGKKVDQRADIFSLGAVFYEILTFQKPFNGDTLTTVIYKIMNEIPPPLPQVVPGLSSALDAIVQKAIAKDIEARYSCCRDIINDLRAYGASTGLAVESVAPTVIIHAPSVSAETKKKKTAAPATAAEAPERGRKPIFIALAVMTALIVIVVAALLLTNKGPGKAVAEGGGEGTPAGAIVEPPAIKPPSTSGSSTVEQKPTGREGKVAPAADDKPAKPPEAPTVKTGENREARLVQEVKPVYPESVRAARVQGDVQVRILVGPDGRVKNAEIILGPSQLAPAALEAVRQWVYEPRMVNGVPSESLIETALSFTLPAEEPPPAVKTEPTKAEPPKVETKKTEPAKAEPTKAEPSKKEPPKTESPKTEPPKAEPAKTEPAKTEPTKSEPPPAKDPGPAKPPEPALKKEPDRAPRVLKKVDPVYPDLARQARIEGEVSVEVRIGTTGRIERAAVVKAVTLLDEAALKAVRQWIFEPAIKDGVPVPMTVTYSFKFNLGAEKPTAVMTPPPESKPTAKPLPSGGTTAPPPGPASKKPGGAPPAPTGFAADLARASEAMNRKNYREAIAAARTALAANPSSSDAQAILTKAMIQIAPVEVKSLIDQYVLSLKVKEVVEYYRLHAAPALFTRVRKDMEIVMGAYDQIQAEASNINLDLGEIRYPAFQSRASFSHLVTGVSRQKGTRETLFNGRYTWRMERRDEEWIIVEITFEKTT